MGEEIGRCHSHTLPAAGARRYRHRLRRKRPNRRKSTTARRDMASTWSHPAAGRPTTTPRTASIELEPGSEAAPRPVYPRTGVARLRGSVELLHAATVARPANSKRNPSVARGRARLSVTCESRSLSVRNAHEASQCRRRNDSAEQLDDGGGRSRSLNASHASDESSTPNSAASRRSSATSSAAIGTPIRSLSRSAS